MHAVILQLDEVVNPVRAFQLENLWVLFYSFIIHFVIIALGPTCFDDFGCNEKEIEREIKTKHHKRQRVLCCLILILDRLLKLFDTDM